MTVSLKKRKSEQTRQEIPVLQADPARGLTAAQAEERRQLGYANTPVQSPGKSVGQIILSNVFTYFNLIFFLLAACVIAVKSWNNLMFMGVVLTNMVIGIVQELRSKRTLDRLNLLNAPRGVAVRDGRELTIDTADMVRDDIVILKSGDQVFADADVVEGTCQVNESLITGEADEIQKRPGDALLSGSFLVSGSCRARLTAVGADSYASKLTLEARRRGKPKLSEMMRSLNNLVKWIGILIIPLGAVMAVKEIHWLGRSLAEGVVSTVAALIGMIPEGLYLLTTLALVASILRLAQKKTLVHEMNCIE
ncbi:MAG: cation-translocating P-type ATPase, partial [Ruminococcaceae bacterium]|nr:cation-translocating P-type ATPase [Oscillospiraceae bacterium]